MKRIINPWAKSANGLRKDRGGTAAVEFAIVAPIFMAVLAISLDLGMAVFERFQIESAVSGAASYAMINGSMVDSTNGSTLAGNMAQLLAGQSTIGTATALVTVNDGVTAAYDGSAIKIGGLASQTNACYCPTGNAGALTWGSQQSCGASCPNGELAGKYVEITLQQAYNPIFANYGITDNGLISANALVRIQ
jgi:Flp pilus assembly protein TadG